ncbi:hypothetical protein FisN_18Lh025 [Fistulifera solaris]|uniref:Vps72/YL1 N-terminal domain-containing protein n=1 Tax=Fistulifera solaris TaxID=1519565 RepID=A0A1Z5K1G4_FISSO|nr:hypothetical protein FisN_18Lh025 [Fistulifera solaris]|eukprot:GAX20087.1 hypothetical protein FisN_18Lh025 [Fistulifera solaris]
MKSHSIIQWQELDQVVESLEAFAGDTEAVEQVVQRVVIHEDDENYDDHDDDDDDENDNDNEEEEEEDKTKEIKEKEKKKKEKEKKKEEENTKKNTTDTKQKNEKSSKSRRSLQPTTTLNAALYEHIPLGMAGAHMLVTFGVLQPLPETVDKALQLTRHALTQVLQQATQLHQQRQTSFRQARQTIRSDIYKSRQIPHSLETYSSEYQYRVLLKHDAAAKTTTWLDLEDLQALFPEQIYAYLQWNQRLLEYQRNKEDNNDDDDVDDEEEEEEEDNDDKDNRITQPATGGHLMERAAHFDQRTCHMKEDWYLQFAQVIRTKGSFLPARDPGFHSTRFWHWIRVPAIQEGSFWSHDDFKEPHPIVSKAMAFLAFDFLGRIIEQAIVYKTHDHNCTELPPDQTLTPNDLYTAVQHHPELQELTASFFQTTTKKKPPKAPQLYFG